jgi:hypothetical protein
VQGIDPVLVTRPAIAESVLAIIHFLAASFEKGDDSRATARNFHHALKFRFGGHKSRANGSKDSRRLPESLCRER